jgi:hypothetical protein
MKARDLITGSHLSEGATPEGQPREAPQPPAGNTSGPRERPPRERPPHGQMRPPLGHPPGPPRMFAGPDESALKDIMLLFLSEGTGNDYDGAIVRQLMSGKDLDRGHLQHILDEGARLQNLPESHVKILEKIHGILQSAPS